MDLILSAATHRSGSTLLQRILNARKQTLIWGEHLGVLRDFQHIQQKVRSISAKGRISRERYFSNGEDPNQWLAVMSPSPEFVDQAIVQSTKAFLDTLYQEHKENHDTIGFKEVRYGGAELSLLQQCYPEAKLLLLVRNPLKAWESYPKNWGEYRSVNQFARQWNNNATYYLELSRRNPQATLIRYESLIGREASTVNKVCELAQLTPVELDGVLSQKIRGSVRPKTITLKQAATIRRICRRNMMKLGYL